TLGVMRELCNRQRSMHAVILATCRSESVDVALTPLRGAPNLLTLGLEPLGTDEVRRIIGGMIARDDPPPRLVEQLTADGGGTPSCVAESRRAAVAGGLLARDHGRWQLREPETARALMAPGSVQSLIARRLDGLPEETRRLVEAGAVLGRAWAPETLAAV